MWRECTWEKRVARMSIGDLGPMPVLMAHTIRARLLGLALLASVPSNCALLIPRCRAIHTFGMRFPIDVLFLDGEGQPLRVVTDIGPWRFTFCRLATAVVEVPAGKGDGFWECLVAGKRLSQARPRGW